MEDQEEEPTTPFWAQSSSHRRRIRRPSPSLFLNSGVLLFTLCTTFSLFIYFIFPTLISFKPSLFKNSWESLNVTLVLLAIIFGFLSRNINVDNVLESNVHDNYVHGNNDHVNVHDSYEGVNVVKSSGSTPRGWYEYSDRTSVVSLRRSYSSYPDLREIEYTGDRWQFYDDTSLARASRGSPVEKTGTRGVIDRWRLDDDTSSVQDPIGSPVRPVQNKGLGDDTLLANNAEEALRMDTGSGSDKPMDDNLSESRRFVEEMFMDGKTTETRESVLPRERIIEPVYEERATPPMPAVRRRTRRTADTGPNKEKSSDDLSGSEKMARRTVEKEESSEEKTYEYESPVTSRIERKRGGNATKHFIDSFRKKKKKQRQKSVENSDALLGSHHPPAPPPPPPRNIFSSKKSKKIITLPPPPPPPPPPPYFTTKAHKSVVAVAPTRVLHRQQQLSVQSGAGGESPLHPIPPPPPPPPFKMKSWKFEVKGDYVRIGSLSSDEVDSPRSSESGETPTALDERESPTGTMFCPSPDVNSKADMFIARFRAGLKLQKLNSMNLKQGLGMSNLGPKTS